MTRAADPTLLRHLDRLSRWIRSGYDGALPRCDGVDRVQDRRTETPTRCRIIDGFTPLNVKSRARRQLVSAETVSDFVHAVELGFNTLSTAAHWMGCCKRTAERAKTWLVQNGFEVTLRGESNSAHGEYLIEVGHFRGVPPKVALAIYFDDAAGKPAERRVA